MFIAGYSISSDNSNNYPQPTNKIAIRPNLPVRVKITTNTILFKYAKVVPTVPYKLTIPSTDAIIIIVVKIV